MTAVPERLKVGWFPLGAAGGYRNDVIDFLGQDGELFQIAMFAPTGVEPAAMRGGPANVSWCRCWGVRRGLLCGSEHLPAGSRALGSPALNKRACEDRPRRMVQVPNPTFRPRPVSHAAGIIPNIKGGFNSSE